jgi:hypothetical protein
MFLMAGGGMLALALIYGRGTLRPGLARAAAPAPLPALPEPTPGGAALRFSLGINEAVSVPQKLLREGHFTRTTLAEHLDLDATRTASLGARFVRGHTGAFPRTSWWASMSERGAQNDADLWVRTVQAHDLEPILMVSPWPANQTANYTDTYVPADLPAYAAWVTALVERYDGDGVDDMPGLRCAVRYWEIDNEPDLKFTTPPRDATRDVPPGSFCTPEEAATVLVATARAIRAASPSARILNGGLYRPFAESGQAWLRGLLAVPGAREAFDVLSLHTYAADEHGDAYVRGLAAARAIDGIIGKWVAAINIAWEKSASAKAKAEDLIAELIASAGGMKAVPDFVSQTQNRMHWNANAKFIQLGVELSAMPHVATGTFVEDKDKLPREHANEGDGFSDHRAVRAELSFNKGR